MTDKQYFKVLRAMYTSPNFTLGKIKKMSRKRFVKLMMARGYSRDEVNESVKALIGQDKFPSYFEAYSFLSKRVPLGYKKH